ncbi:toll/interleukin-1 receptor domain-containing protein [Variovorax sp. J22P240]|uniref:toll/interleukin-1 receptor domain-containing protein n=1 Tax=Variovorax sp. J22P240 TaxID=3053514 RepID=UPI00257620D9|nr:toll/interleukin-1 receptor domain-containing protein [Variovorax sp. J22P240]MDM0001826.1 toll/interleukin-1 receptor domain-containing protein [Variovorax sp. J22P240]
MNAPNGGIARLNVFLSYRSVEARFADILKECLRRDFIGLVEVFLASDTTSVPAGTRWLSEVIEALKASDLHLIICSHYSVRRPWINYEAGAAGVREVPIIPLCHSGLVPNQLPVPLSESEGGVITDPDTIRKLYILIASLLKSSVPVVDYEGYAEEFRKKEDQFSELMRKEQPGDVSEDKESSSLEPELIKDPHVLCVTSSQFRELGYANQLQIVLDAFPKDIRHNVVSNSADFKRILLDDQVDIIHIAAFVCPRGGDLYFSPVELPLGRSSSEDVDLVAVDVLVALLKRSRTRLVVLGGSASLVLATELLPVTNVIAARDMVSAKAMASWVETFYDRLTRESLVAASELASHVSQAPMKLYAQQRDAPSMTFRLTDGMQPKNPGN